MNQLSFLSGGFSAASGLSQPFMSAGLSAQLNINLSSVLGSGMTSYPQFGSSMMQSLFGGGQTDPLSAFLQQMSGGYGSMGGYGDCSGMGSAFGGYGSYGGGYDQFSPWANNFGGQCYGGYGSSPEYYNPQQGYGNGWQSPCQDFGFGRQCPPHRRDFDGDHSCGCHGQGGRQSGQLSQEAEGKPISYTTSGGYKVSVDGSTINVTDPNGKNTVKTWGDPHESVNGQHVSDWQGKQRTIVLDDGTKLTMEAQAANGVVQSMNIFDGNQSVSIDNTANKVTGHTYNPYETRALDQQQYDGSVAYLRNSSNGSMSFANMYTQDENFNIDRNYQLLATVDSNGAVTDHFDA